MYAIVTPVRDEATNLARLATCLLAQSTRPQRWVIVDNGSADETLALAHGLAGQHAWIRVVEIAGEAVATRGAPVVRALRAGIAAVGETAEIIVKVDADVSLPPDHFERLVDRFAADPALGIASGSRWELRGGCWRQQYVTGTSVEGQCRAYRRRCLDEVSPLEERLGWDGLDEMKANGLGWTTRAFRELPFRHHRDVAQREPSRISAWVAQGEANHYMGYRPSYALLRSVRRALRDPAALALAGGYLRAQALRRPRCADPVVRRHVRSQQALRRVPRRIAEALGHGTARTDVLLVAQGGGHLFELVALRRAWSQLSRVWVTVDAAGSRSLLRGESVRFARGSAPRGGRDLLANVGLAARLTLRLQPAAIVTTGGAIAVPFAWFGRVIGARVIYIECGGRADKASLACRLIAPVAERIYVQWPELVDVIANSHYVGRVAPPTELADAPSPPMWPPIGTLVTVGTCPYPFDRLMRVVDDLPHAGGVFAQTGHSRELPQRARSADFLTFEALASAMRQARAVVLHGGVGSVLLAHACGKRPIVVPRRADLGENIDDHQLAFARRLADAGMITLVEDPEQLPATLARLTDADLTISADADTALAMHVLNDLVAQRRPPGRAAIHGTSNPRFAAGVSEEAA